MNDTAAQQFTNKQIRYLYAVTRRDLPPPHRTVQVAHAVLAATHSYGNPHLTHPHLVVCAVENEKALEDLFESLKQQSVPVVAFYEDDLDDQLTAIATGLLAGDERKPLRWLPLLK